MVPATRAAVRQPLLRDGRGHLVCRVYICGNDAEDTLSAWGERYGSVEDDIQGVRDADGGGLAGEFLSRISDLLQRSSGTRIVTERQHRDIQSYLTMCQLDNS